MKLITIAVFFISTILLAEVGFGADAEKEAEASKDIRQAIANVETKSLDDARALAPPIASRHGRAVHAPLLELLITLPTEKFTLFFSDIAIEAIGGDGSRDLKKLMDEGSGCHPQVLTLAAIAYPADSEALRLLLRAATAEYPDFSMGYIYGCRFLRGFDPALVRPEIDKAVRADIEDAKQKHPDEKRQAAAKHRASLLAYLKYMEALPPDDRTACMDFNRRLWHSRTRMVSPGEWHFTSLEYMRSAGDFLKVSKPGDEQFLRHSLHLDVDPYEVQLAIAIAGFGHMRTLMPELEVLAEHGDPKYIKYARYALKRVKEDKPEATTQPGL